MRSITAALAASTLVLTACTGSSAEVENDPEGALRDAVEALGDYDGVELVLSASGDAAALADDPEDLDAVELLLSGTVTMRGSGESEEDAQFELVVDLDGTEVFEVRVLPQTQVFLRADVDAVAQAIDDPAITADLQELVAAAEQFGFGDLAQVAVDGGWIELTGVEQLTEFAEGFGGMDQTEEPSEEELERLQEQVVSAFDRFIDQDVAVTYVGSEDAGERVQATADGAALESLFQELTAIAADAGGVDPAMLGDLESDIPEGETFTLDAWIDGGELSQIGIDLGGLDDSGEIPADTFLLVGIADFAGSIEAPAEAEPFDLFGLISGFLFGGLDGMDGLGGPGFDEGMLEDEGLDDGLEEDLGGAPGGDLEEEFGEDLDAFEDLDLECVPQDEVDEFGLEELVDEGFLEVC